MRRAWFRPWASRSDTVELLVLRSVEIDSQLENDPQETLGLLPKTLSRIRAAIQEPPTLNAGICFAAASLYIVRSVTFRKSATSLMVRISLLFAEPIANLDCMEKASE